MSLMLSLAAALGLSFPDGDLEIANPRATFGYLGAVRPKAPRLPGDQVFFCFEVRNLKLEDGVKAQFSMLVEVFNPKGEKIYYKGPVKHVAHLSFGGMSVPCQAQLDIPLGSEAGEYTLKITIHDRLADKTTVFTGKGEVTAPDFGLVRIGTFCDPAGHLPCAAVGVVGEQVYLHYSAVGFGRDKATKQPNLDLSLTVLDDKGKPATTKPMTGKVDKGVPEDAPFVPLLFPLTLDRAGGFTLEVTARDNVLGKTSTFRLPIRVLSVE